MKILMINVVCGIRSTGRICTDIATALDKRGHEVKIAYGREDVPEQYKKYAVRIGNNIDVKLHGLKSRLFDRAGFGSKRATEKFIEWVKKYDPDIIHLHNIHGYYINVEVLFNYLRTCDKKIIWSLYDCWSFTGHCAHFDYHQCSKWKIDCKNCDYITEYPKSFISSSRYNYKKKCRLFTYIPNLQLVVPSHWMKKIVEQSYMKEYPVLVMPNGIDISLFSPITSSFREKNNILPHQCMVLGVSSFWTREKGIECIIELANRLDQSKYRIVIVGKILEGVTLPKIIIHINSTNNIKELCEIYSAADIFVNPTLQETQGLTTLEAFACGTPAVVFSSGGAAECVNDTCGIIVERNNITELLSIVKKIGERRIIFEKSKCIHAAKEYDIAIRNEKILQLYIVK